MNNFSICVGKRCILATGREGQQVVFCHQWFV